MAEHCDSGIFLYDSYNDALLYISPTKYVTCTGNVFKGTKKAVRDQILTVLRDHLGSINLMESLYEFFDTFFLTRADSGFGFDRGETPGDEGSDST